MINFQPLAIFNEHWSDINQPGGVSNEGISFINTTHYLSAQPLTRWRC
jgi:hypothetical protein